MNEPKVIYDAVESLANTTGSLIFFIVLGVGFPCLLLFFGVRAFRKAQTKATKGRGIVVGVIGLLSLATGLGSLLTDGLANEVRQQIEKKDYTEVQGRITNLTESTMLAGNPAATFEVSDHLFEYGRGSDNYELNMVEKGGILANGISVRIWFNNDKILRIYHIPEENLKKHNKSEMATPRKPSD